MLSLFKILYIINIITSGHQKFRMFFFMKSEVDLPKISTDSRGVITTVELKYEALTQKHYKISNSLNVFQTLISHSRR